MDPMPASRKQFIAHSTLVVKEYDEAINFYTQKLRFTLVDDIGLGDDKRWVVIMPPGAETGSVLLARAVNNEQLGHVGNQTGGRVALFLYTDNFARDYVAMQQKGVVFASAPREEIYGTVAVFKDLYGNLWDLLQPASV